MVVYVLTIESHQAVFGSVRLANFATIYSFSEF